MPFDIGESSASEILFVLVVAVVEKDAAPHDFNTMELMIRLQDSYEFVCPRNSNSCLCIPVYHGKSFFTDRKYFGCWQKVNLRFILY